MKGGGNGHISASFISKKSIVGQIDSNYRGDEVARTTQGSTGSFVKTGENSWESE